MSEIQVTCTTQHEARDRGRAECTRNSSRLSTFPIHWGSAKKTKQTTKRNTVELKMVSERKVAVPLLLSLHPKQEGWKKHKTQFSASMWALTEVQLGRKAAELPEGISLPPIHTATDPLCVSRWGLRRVCQLF